jgi:plasmid stability protein
MVRTQIQLTESQFEALRERAAAEGRSMADVIRGLVDESVSSVGRPSLAERRKRALAAIGFLGKKGPKDLSARHDDYLAEAWR